MFGENQFLELPVIGLLLIAGCSPWIACMSPRLRQSTDVFPGFGGLTRLPERGVGIALLLVLAVMVGMVGNALIDTAVHDSWAGWNSDWEGLYDIWLSERPAVPAAAPCAGSAKAVEPGIAPSLKAAEHALGNGSDSEYTRAYLMRHKAIMRVLRSAAVAAIVFFAGMVLFQGLRRWRRWPVPAYSTKHMLIAVVMSIVLTVAYFEEVADFHKRVFELYTRTNAKQFHHSHSKPCKMCRDLAAHKISNVIAKLFCE
jgi:hypothetical protein